MVLLIKHRFVIYRRYEEDIGGISFSDARASKVRKYTTKDLLVREVKSPYIRFFYTKHMVLKAERLLRKQRYVYRLDVLPPDIRRTRQNKRFVSVRLTRLYYITMQNYQFRSMFARANKADGNLNINYSYLLEGRSLCIYYRSLFAASLFESLRFIRSGNFTIDGSFILSYNALIPLGKFYFPRINLMNRLRAYIGARTRIHAVSFNVPLFIFISFYTMRAVLLEYPLINILGYPLELDLTRMTGFY